jgi:hypothetical protein
MKPIESTKNTVNGVGVCEGKARDLCAIDVMMANKSVQERKFGIKLVYLEVGMGRIGKNDANTRELAHRSVSFTIIVRALAEALSDETSLLLSLNDVAFRSEFVGEDPVDANGLPTSRKGGLFKDIAVMKTIEFALHGRAPDGGIGSNNGFFVGVWCGVDIEGFDWLVWKRRGWQRYKGSELREKRGRRTHQK